MGACASVSKGMNNEHSSPSRATTPARAPKPDPTQEVDQQTIEGEGVAVNTDGNYIGSLLDNEEVKEEKEATVEAQKEQEEARVSIEHEEEAKEEELELVNKIKRKEETLEEVYGYGGVSMVAEVLTDKITRYVAAVREVVKDYGGKMVDPGSFMFKFMRVRVVNIKATDVDKDQLRDIALDAGAEELLSLRYMKMIPMRIDQRGNAPSVSD